MLKKFFRNTPVLRQGWARRIERFIAIGAEAFFPGICCGCGQLFRLPQQTGGAIGFEQWMGRYLCSVCAAEFQAVHSPLCPRCGQPFASSHGMDHICGQCLAQPFRFSAARAAGLYEGGLQTAIQRLKYQGRESLAKPLGRLLWQTLVGNWDPEQIDRVIPVPLHPRRLRRRGFNQAGVLVREWVRLAGEAGFSVPLEWIDRRLLQRQRPTQPQTGLKREQRVNNLQHAFKVNSRLPSRAAKNLRVLLVDDVMTTGATADACAQTLLAAGAAEVRVLTLARAVTIHR